MLETLLMTVKILLNISFFGSLLIISKADLKTRTIPDIWVGIILLLATTNIACGGLHWATASISCVAVGVVTLVIALIRDDWLGGGDIKLCFAVSAFSGADVFLFAFSIGVVISLVVVAVKNRKNKTKKSITIPLAPYLTIGYGIFYLTTILNTLKGVI